MLPVGGPGEAVTPLQQSEILFDLFDKEPKYIKVPIAVFDAIISIIDFFANFSPGLKDTVRTIPLRRRCHPLQFGL